MNIDEHALKLANAFRGAYQGDNSQLLIIDEMKEDAISYTQLLLQIIKSGDPIMNIALVELKNILILNFESFPPDFIQFLCNEHIELVNIIDNPKQFSLIVPNILLLYNSLGEAWEDFPNFFNVENGKLAFQIELSYEFLLGMKKNIDFIVTNIDTFLHLASAGLEQEDWDIKINSIRITFLLAGFDPESVEQHVNYIFTLIDQSPSLSEGLFLSLWTEFSALIEVIGLPEEQLQRVYDPAIQSLSSEHLSIDAKTQVLTVLELLPNISEEMEMDILNHAFDLLLAKIADEEFLDSTCDIYIKAIDDHGAQSIYDFMKEKISDSITPENATAFLYIMKSLTEKAGTQIKNDWSFFNDLIEKTSESKPEDNILLFSSCLMFISSLDGNFEMQLMESNLFSDFSIPLIICPISEIHLHAQDAVYKALDSVSGPIIGITDKIWSINSDVTVDTDKYLTLLAKGIEMEGDNFDSEKAIHMSEFIVSCYEDENNDEMLIGALSVATTLILTNEVVHEILVQPTVAAIERCFDSQSVEVQANGLLRMSALFPSFKEAFSQESIEKVEQLIQNQNKLIIEQAATCFFVIAKEMEQKEAVYDVLPLFQKYIVEQDKDYFTIAVTVVQSLSPILDEEKIAELTENICNAASETKNEEILSDCFDSVGSILSKTADNSKVIEMSSGFAFSFMQGKFVICNQNEPLDCDFKLSTIKSFARLLCELLHYELELNELTFLFTQSLLSSSNIEYVDLALSILSDGVLYEGFNSNKEKAFIVSYTQSICDVENTSIILVESIANLLLCLIEKDFVSAEVCEKIFPVVIQWWQNIYSNMKEVMLPTLSNLSILIWSIALKYDALVPEVFEQSFELFPPKDESDTFKACNLLAIIATNEQLRANFTIPITLAISKLLVLPKMLIAKKDVTDEILMKLGAIFNELYNSSSDIQNAIAQQISDSQVLQERISSFIQ